jgi:hypothetical protein
MFYSWLVDDDSSAFRFPAPWSIQKLKGCFVVQDSAGQRLGYFYYEGRASQAVKTEDAHL